MLLCIWAGAAYAELGRDLRQACTNRIEQRTGALIARDWDRLESESRAYVRDCAKVFGAEDLAQAYENMSIAQFEAGKVQAVLLTVDRCLSAYYATPGCHLHRVKALLALRRSTEAKESLERAERLVESGIQRLEREMVTLRGSEKELADAQLDDLRAKKSLAEAIRETHFAH